MRHGRAVGPPAKCAARLRLAAAGALGAPAGINVEIFAATPAQAGVSGEGLIVHVGSRSHR